MVLLNAYIKFYGVCVCVFIAFVCVWVGEVGIVCYNSLLNIPQAHTRNIKLLLLCTSGYVIFGWAHNTKLACCLRKDRKSTCVD